MKDLLIIYLVVIGVFIGMQLLIYQMTGFGCQFNYNYNGYWATYMYECHLPWYEQP